MGSDNLLGYTVVLFFIRTRDLSDYSLRKSSCAPEGIVRLPLPAVPPTRFPDFNLDLEAADCSKRESPAKPLQVVVVCL